MMIFAKAALYGILGLLLGVGGISVVDNFWTFLGVLIAVTFIDVLAYVDGQRGG